MTLKRNDLVVGRWIIHDNLVIVIEELVYRPRPKAWLNQVTTVFPAKQSYVEELPAAKLFGYLTTEHSSVLCMAYVTRHSSAKKVEVAYKGQVLISPDALPPKIAARLVAYELERS